MTFHIERVLRARSWQALDVHRASPDLISWRCIGGAQTLNSERDKWHARCTNGGNHVDVLPFAQAPGHHWHTAQKTAYGKRDNH